MVKSPEVLVLVPARGGSKSIVRKNIKLLGGAPLIAYSICAAQKAKSVSRIIVTTDDPEIAATAKSYGAEIPFLRPAELAQDDTLDLPVFQHALGWLKERESYVPDVIVQLRPTSPFRPPDAVDRAVKTLVQNQAADSVRTIIPSGQNPYKMWRIESDGKMKPLLDCGIPEAYNMARQKLPPTFWQTGHVDCMRYGTIMEQKSMTGRTIYPLVLDPAYAVDIDTPLDWDRAEWILDRGHLEIARPAQAERSDSTAGRADASARDIRLLVLDFDGVMTDNRVWVDRHGTEGVWCHRGDGWGLARLRETGMQILVLSTEVNPVVSVRCCKLGIECVQACNDKLAALKAIAEERSLSPSQIAYVGNDVNDLDCLRWVGLPISVADGVSEVQAVARMVTRRVGGQGAVREVCDFILSQKQGATTYGKTC